MSENKIHRLDVESPLGVVHLAGFAQKPDHRAVIFGLLSEFFIKVKLLPYCAQEAVHPGIV